MPPKTIYLAQTFHWRGGQLMPGEAIRFRTPAEATAASLDYARHADGAAAMKMDGDPAADAWEEPTVLVGYGAIPGKAA